MDSGRTERTAGLESINIPLGKHRFVEKADSDATFPEPLEKRILAGGSWERPRTGRCGALRQVAESSIKTCILGSLLGPESGKSLGNQNGATIISRNGNTFCTLGARCSPGGSRKYGKALPRA